MAEHRRLYVESRYRKLTRDLPQTRFYCPRCRGRGKKVEDCETCGGYGKLTRDSIEELVARRFLPSFKAKTGKFHGAGREDMDVRMLGRGRPFVYEVIHSRRWDIDLEALRERFHDREGERVELAPFRMVERERIAELKEGKFRKLYCVGVGAESADAASCIEILSAKIDEVLPIEQRTPDRVAHRRADMIRERDVVIRAVREAEDVPFEIDLETAHGTYVKEFISSDEGRTTPSLASLLPDASGVHCARLDVLEVYDEILLDSSGEPESA